MKTERVRLSNAALRAIGICAPHPWCNATGEIMGENGEHAVVKWTGEGYTPYPITQRWMLELVPVKQHAKRAA